MKRIDQLVSQVIRRLFLQDLVTRLPYYLLVFMGIAAVAWVVPRLVYWEPLSTWAQHAAWEPAWGWGSVVLAVSLCLLSCWRTRANRLLAAEELDRRFGLKERVSSVLASSEAIADPAFYRALVADTQAKIDAVHVPDHFPISPRWPLALPLFPMLLLLGLLFVPLALPSEEDVDSVLSEQERKALAEQIKEAKLKEKEDSIDPDEELEGSEMVKKAMEAAAETLQKKDVSKREAMVAINDVKKAVEDEQKRLGQTEALKERLKQLAEQSDGPAEKLNKALQQGDLSEAKSQMAQLAEKLATGQMTEEDQKRLGEQMEELKQQLDGIREAVEKEKQDLQRQIDEAMAEGDLQRAAELQKKKEALENQQRQMDQLKKLADKADKIAEMMKDLQNGQPMNEQQKQELKDAMQQMQEQLENMQLDQQQMKELQELMEQMEEMKQGMRGEMPGEGEQPGDGEGQGEGEGEGEGDKPGEGLGKGQGKGERPEAEDDTKFYDTQTKPEVKPGQVAKIGQVGGPNRKGVTRVEIENALQNASESKELTPSDLQDIPIKQRDHVRQYFQKLRSK